MRRYKVVLLGVETPARVPRHRRIIQRMQRVGWSKERWAALTCVLLGWLILLIRFT